MRCIIGFVLLIALSNFCLADGRSQLTLKISKKGMLGTLELAKSDVQRVFKFSEEDLVNPNLEQSIRDQILNYVKQNLAIFSQERNCPLHFEQEPFSQKPKSQTLAFKVTPDCELLPPTQLDVTYTLFMKEIPDHSGVVMIEDDMETFTEVVTQDQHAVFWTKKTPSFWQKIAARIDRLFYGI